MQNIWKITSGRVFKNSKFYEFSAADQSITVVRPWPNPMCWIKELKGNSPCWKAAYPEDFDLWVYLYKRGDRLKLPKKKSKYTSPQLSLPMFKSQKFSSSGLIERYYNESRGQLPLPFCGSDSVTGAFAILKLFSAIPASAKDVIVKFPFNRWHVLNLLARCGQGAYDLIRSNSTLAFCLANGRFFHKSTNMWRSVRSLLTKKQRHIAKWLGFPSTQQAIKILRKIPTDVISEIITLRYLRSSLHDNRAVKLFSHVPKINADVIRIVSDPVLNATVTTNFLRQTALAHPGERFARYAYTLRDTVNMHNEHFNRSKTLLIDSLEHLKGCHDRYVREINNRERPEIRDIKFPSPPFPAFETEGLSMEPLQSPGDLVAEGQQQCICCGNMRYIENVAQGRGYFYRILRPERATVYFSIQDSDIVAQIAGHGNDEVPVAKKAVLGWLRSEGAENFKYPTNKVPEASIQ